MAQEVARLFALQWHQDGLAPYIVFEGRSDHGDGEILSAQAWLSSHFSVANPVEEMIKRSRLAERTFKRRFGAATGLAPIAYVQRLRIEDAKRRLERTDASVDEISWRVGYEDAGVLPAPVQAHHRDGAGRLSQALPDSGIRPALGLGYPSDRRRNDSICCGRRCCPAVAPGVGCHDWAPVRSGSHPVAAASLNFVTSIAAAISVCV